MDNLEFEFIECLNEMASVCPIGQTSILLAINPDDNRDGDPYFKMYDSNSWGTATKVWRIRFDRKNIKGEFQQQYQLILKKRKI